MHLCCWACCPRSLPFLQEENTRMGILVPGEDKRFVELR